MREALYKISYMIILTIVFTTGVVVVKSFTAGRITLNEQLFERQKIIWALNLSKDEDLTGIEVEQIFQERIQEYLWTEKNATIYADVPGGEVKGYAFPIVGAGLWGPIHGYLGIDPDGERLTGISFTKHSETPGLGGRIEEEEFREQFEGLDIDEPEDGIYVQFVREGQAAGKGEVHAITGATQTSKALKKFLNEDLGDFLEALEQGSLEKFDE